MTIDGLRVATEHVEPVFRENGAFAGVIEQLCIAGRWYAKRRDEQYAVGQDCRACAIAYVRRDPGDSDD